MTAVSPIGTCFEFDAFRTAVAATFVFAVLSVLVPTLTAATGALAALAVAGWVSLVQRRGVGSDEGLRRWSILAVISLAAASVVFIHPLAFLTAFRGPVLAAGFLPLVLVERARSSNHGPSFSR